MPQDDAALLAEIRQRYDYACEQWHPIRVEGDTDMRFVAGDPWDARDRRAREQAGRPCLSIDELNQYFNQSINDVRANPLAMKFSPRGNGADDKGAEFYQDKAREIEYRSHAQMAYTTAFENCVQRSFGYVRLTTKWINDVGADDDPFRQEIWIEPLENPNQVTPDPDFRRPDGSDMKFCFIEERRAYEDFAREYPQSEAKSFSGELKTQAPRWFGDRGVTLAEYWTITTTKRTLHAVKTRGGTRNVFADEMAKGEKGTIVKSREVESRQVWCYLTNGIEILKRTRWPGKYIPVAACLGKVLWRNDEGKSQRTILSMTRLARDPQMLYAYYRTCEAELVGLTPKFPYFAYKGTLDQAQKELIAKSLHEPVAVIEVEGSPEGVLPGTILPLPSRQPYEPPIAALEMGAESARRAIQAAMGISPLPTEALRLNQKSGRALQQVETSQQKGSYHFKDHYLDMIHHVGVMVEDLIDKIHDTEGETPVRRSDETSAMVRINDPSDERAIHTKGNYLVTVAAGPSFESTRQAAEDFLDKIAGLPAVFPLVASEMVRLKQLGPIGDQIADILDLLKPPQVQAMLQQKKQGGQPDPQVLMGQLQGMQKQLGDAEQVMQAQKQAIDTEQVKQQATIQKAQIDFDREIRLQQMKDATSIRVAQIAAESKGMIADSATQVQTLALQQKSQDAELTRSHQAAMAAMGQAGAMQQQDQAHAQGLETQDRQHAQSLEAGAVAHDQELETQEQGAEFTAQQQAAMAAQQPDVSEAGA